MRGEGCGLLALAAMACGGGPQIQATAAYRPPALRGAKVLYVPLAVTSDIGDDRTGIILSDRTGELSGSVACHRTAEGWDEGKLVCFDQGRGAPILETIMVALGEKVLDE